MISKVIIGCLIVIPAIAAKTKRIDYQPTVEVSIQEILDMPMQNRLALVSKQKTYYKEKLEKLIFSEQADYTLKWKSLTLLVQVDKDHAEPILKKAIKAKEWYLRNAALLGYSELKPKEVSQIARGLLDDPALVVRSAAVTALENSLDDESREVLWMQMSSEKNFRKNQSLFIRPQILSLLAKDPSVEEKARFASYAEDADLQVRESALKALKKISL